MNTVITTSADPAAPAASDTTAAPSAPKASMAIPKSVVSVKKPMAKPPAAKAPAVATKAPTAKTSMGKAAGTKTAKEKPSKAQAPKVKMVRDSFTFPQSDHKLLTDLKKRVTALGHEVKKGELVRVGVAILAAMDDKAVLAAVAKVDKLKTGRPKK